MPEPEELAVLRLIRKDDFPDFRGPSLPSLAEPITGAFADSSGGGANNVRHPLGFRLNGSSAFRPLCSQISELLQQTLRFRLGGLQLRLELSQLS